MNRNTNERKKIIHFFKCVLPLYISIIGIIFFGCAKDEVQQENKIKKTLIQEHPYWSKLFKEEVSDKDTIFIPFIYETNILLRDIIDFKTNKTDFIISLDNYVYNDYNEFEETISNDTIPLNPINFFDIDQRFTDVRFDTYWEWDGYFEDVKKTKYYRHWENQIYHNWDLKNYPFDKQIINIEFSAFQDTSIVRIRSSKDFKNSVYENLPNLTQGFKIDDIVFKEIFRKSRDTLYLDQVIDKKFDRREEIYSVGRFEIIISRSGFSLFIKLFLGAILALILSVSVFYIPKGEFDAKSQISVGAIFAAVGNKYFVDSNTISNVLTVADIINNSVIFLVIFNVFIMIAQRSEIINWKWLEEDKNAVKFSFVTMAIITLTILLLYI